MTRTLLTTLFALTTGCVLHVENFQDSDVLTYTAPIEQVRYDLAAGDVDIRVGDVTETTVRRIWRWTGDRPTVDVQLVDGELIIDVDCQQRAFGSCSVDHEIVLPATASVIGDSGAGEVTIAGATDVDVTTGSGGVFVRDVPGAVSVYTGSGDVDLDEIDGDLTVETGSGEILARDLFSSWIWAATGSGDVDLELELRPDALTIETGSGDVILEVPPGTYDVTTHTGSGDVDVTGITTSSGATSTLDIETGSGDVTIYAE